MNIKSCKYVHVFMHNAKVFYKNCIETIRDEKSGINEGEHLFLVFCEDVFQELKQFDNVVSVNQYVKNPEVVINTWAEKCDWMFIHSLDCTSRFLRVKKKYLRKIIWRTWGHDGKVNYTSNKFKNFIKNLFLHQYRFNKRVKYLKAIGVANIIDVIDLNKRFARVPKVKNVPKVVCSYPSKEDCFKKEDYPIPKDNKIKVLLGHSGYYTDKHIEILELLKDFDLSNVRFYIIISYGNPYYIDELKAYVNQNNLSDAVQYVTDFLPLGKYNSLISKMDIGILGGEDSYAIGCLGRLITYSKKIYVNKNGVHAKALKIASVPHFYFQDIKEKGLEMFTKKVEYKGSENALALKDKEFYFKKWRDLLDWLNGKEVDVDISKNID